MAVSRCPVDLHSVSLMAPVIAIIHLTVKSRKKKGKRGEIACTISLLLPCVQPTCHPTVGRTNTQAPPRRNMPVLVWLTTRTCVGELLCLSVLAPHCMISRWSAHKGGKRWTCLILQLIKSTRDLFPWGRESGPHINTSLFSRQEKQERKRQQRRRGEGVRGDRKKDA